MFNMTLLLYYFLSIVIISMSSLSRAFREKRCKVTTFFSFPQTFCSKFCCRPSGASRPPPDDRFLKSECKVTPFVRNRQIFSPLFSIKIPNKSAIAWESTPAEHEKKDDRALKAESSFLNICVAKKIDRLIIFSFSHLTKEKNLGREMVGIAVQKFASRISAQRSVLI